MSQWTHVCGVIRYDDIRKAMLKPEPEYRLALASRFQIPIPPVPFGSEGPLTCFVNLGANCDAYSYMSSLTIVGDLRDFGHDDLTDLEDFWNDATSTAKFPPGVGVRSAVMLIEVEGEDPIVWKSTGTERSSRDFSANG